MPESRVHVPSRSLLTTGWLFHLGEAPGAALPQYDDAAWREVELPHDWSVEGEFDASLASCTGYLPGGIGWYRRTLRLPESVRGARVAIDFGGVYCNSEVWCNGVYLGKRPYGYASFSYELTPHLRFGEEGDVLSVRVDHSRYADSRWYTGSGITRDVHLAVTDHVRLGRYGVFVTTPEVSEERAIVHVETTVVNGSDEPAQVEVVSSVVDPAGEEVAVLYGRLPLGAGGTAGLRQAAVLEDPRLWSLESPTLYCVRTELTRDGECLDRTETPLGIRWFDFDPDAGFALNGVGLKMKGVCVHHDAGALGAAVPARAWERRLRILREMGCNAIRTSHNPPDPGLLDLCDSMGFLVMDEAFDEWGLGKKKWTNGWCKGQYTEDGYFEAFEEWHEADLEDMILRDRNHPSIVLWSIGNEIDMPNDAYPPNSEELLRIAERLTDLTHELDPTRPVTSAVQAVETCLFTDVLDVAGYNYQERRYAADHAAHPTRVIYGSENGHRTEQWRAVSENDSICGQFLWTGIDFLGEAGAWPNRGSQAGCLDLAAFPKPRYWHRKALWTDDPMVRLDEDDQGVVCFSNCETVEFFVDDRSLGERPVPPERMLRPEAAPGALRAVGRVGGDIRCEHALPAFGPPAQVLAVLDASELSADGRDVAHIEIAVVDESGARVRDAATPITCTVTGSGRLLGLENGDQFSHESCTSNVKKAHKGRLLAFVQSRPEAGEIRVAVSAEGLRDSVVVVPTVAT